LETLLPVIVGGLIGLAGGIAGPPLSHWLNEGSSNKKKRAEKLEEMIGYIYAHAHWLNVIKNVRVYGEQDNRDQSPLPMAQAIAAIYFPQFTQSIAELDVAADQYEIWMLEAAQRRLAGDVANLNQGGLEAHRPYMTKRFEVLGTLREYAASEFATKPVLWKRFKKGD